MLTSDAVFLSIFFYRLLSFFFKIDSNFKIISLPNEGLKCGNLIFFLRNCWLNKIIRYLKFKISVLNLRYLIISNLSTIKFCLDRIRSSIALDYRRCDFKSIPVKSQFLLQCLALWILHVTLRPSMRIWNRTWCQIMQIAMMITWRASQLSIHSTVEVKIIDLVQVSSIIPTLEVTIFFKLYYSSTLSFSPQFLCLLFAMNFHKM